MENIVEPYYYSYEYFSRFGEFPYGDRGHDLVGVIETYQQIDIEVGDGCGVGVHSPPQKYFHEDHRRKDIRKR